MTVWEIALIGVALSMDAVAVGMTNGMEEPRMSGFKAVCVALVYGLFQALMPVIGYELGSAFAGAVAKIAPWLSFGLLAFLGGKMIFDELTSPRGKFLSLRGRHKLGAGKLLAQGIATSIDALAVGVALLAEETFSGLPVPMLLCALLIGMVTFVLSCLAVELGKRVGDRISAGTEALGGFILLAIGLKILFEGIFS